MSGKPLESIDASSAISARLASLDPSQQVAGSLSKWQDGQNNSYWEFVGNGATTGTQLMQKVAEREAEDGNEALRPVAGDESFARLAANSLLGPDDADKPIPKGQTKELSLKSLVALINPFLERYAKQISGEAQNAAGTDPAAAEAAARPADDHKRMTGDVRSAGLSLPLDS